MLSELKREKHSCSQNPGSVPAQQQFGVVAEIFMSPFTAAEAFVLIDKYFQENSTMNVEFQWINI